MADIKTKLKRKAKFSREELETLVDTYGQHSVKLNAKFSPNVTKAHKDHIWVIICDAVNSVGLGVPRTIQDIKNKYKEHKKVSKATSKYIRSYHEHNYLIGYLPRLVRFYFQSFLL